MRVYIRGLFYFKYQNFYNQYKYFFLQISVYNVISFKHFIFIRVSHKYFSSKSLEKVVHRSTSPKSSGPEADLISGVYYTYIQGVHKVSLQFEKIVTK